MWREKKLIGGGGRMSQYHGNEGKTVLGERVFSGGEAAQRLRRRGLRRWPWI